MPKVTQEHLDARRTQILDGARRAFAEHGYEGATVARLEEATGLSRGAIFHYFGNKQDLFVALAWDLNTRLGDILLERGLADAVRALALDTPLRTETDIDLPGRLDAPVESACYFAIAEALTNAVKHSGARQAQVRIQHARGMLRAEVTDDGCGGADPARGSGLAGIERRLGTFDGIMAVSSPPGGPTMIVMEVPCALSSPRTSSS